MPRDLAQLVLAVRKLALGAVAARALFLPAAAQLRLVQPKFSVIRTRPRLPARARGACDARLVAARVLRLEARGHDLLLRGDLLRAVVLARVHRGDALRQRRGREHAPAERALHAVSEERKARVAQRGGRVRRGVVVGRAEDVVLLLHARHCRVVAVRRRRHHHLVKLLRVAEREMRGVAAVAETGGRRRLRSEVALGRLAVVHCGDRVSRTGLGELRCAAGHGVHDHTLVEVRHDGAIVALLLLLLGVL